MVTKAKIVRAAEYDPWYNLAAEEYLLDNVAEGECILYLWQNQNTVVIGKNQNPWKECRTSLLESEGGKLARRLSGGGAVFHDTGNLNFTFIMKRADYDLERQVGTILSAVRMLGIDAEMTGRNDLTVNGRKFSGNAYCFRKDSAYHHGTILVSADMKKLSRYLQVSEEKMRSKGVESVKARVTNLNEYNKALTIADTAEALIKAFRDIYCGNAPIYSAASVCEAHTVDGLYQKYASWEWRYGEGPEFDLSLETRFSWGGIELGLVLRKGQVEQAVVYSDAMDEEAIGRLPEVLKGSAFNSKAIAAKLTGPECTAPGNTYYEDIAAWLLEKNF